ncbi:Oidioi.mRNA.OKI2018_I69.PAR.g13091.t1.cds [Oikopleura dioica]|uniref:procollagen-proline 4-dioxygenase n=1 Tax=Oikopleura dioica TaxID=34765 RepID=A0ABN7S7N6_OIKDI|nr:Oidioi.mRNA.OKI2018_I69.PAR.g13091.t1.cds [Oikopleura dioica]
METLLKFEENLLEKLLLKLEEKVEKLAFLEEKIEEMQKERESQGNEHLSHPVNQFKLIRRFSKDWHEISESLTSHSPESDLISQIKPLTSKVQDTKSAEIAENGLLRLQETYFLSAADLQQGLGEFYNGGMEKDLPKLTAKDCFDIGRRAYMNGGSMRVVHDWMKLTLQNADKEKDFDLMIDALDHLAYAKSQIGDQRGALMIYNKLKSLQPDEKRYEQNVNYYGRKWIERARGETEQEGMDHSKLSTRAADHRPEREETEYYEKLCRMPNELPEEKLLRCFYWSNNDHPFLMLGPVKAEELWDEPEIIRFYEIITDEELEIINKQARPKSNLATVQDPITGKLVNADYRISESAWLPANTDSEEDQKLRQFRNRISIITGLTMERAEDIQYSNYGIGGQYEPHYDMSTENDAGKFDEEDGNRIATWLTYLNEPKHGGDTAFLGPGIKAEPIHKSAVFWYNLLRDGSCDYRTRHAACPVLIGQKTVSNIWFHERGEEFSRKCLLNQTDKSTLNMFPDIY